MTNKFKFGVVFGVFDKLHEGHQFFLKNASKQVKKIVVIVVRDSIVRFLKKRKPFQSEGTRLNHIKKLEYVTDAELGDKNIGVYNNIKRLQPDVIFLGYDQTTLKLDLQKKMNSGIIPMIPLVVLKAHRLGLCHTSLLKKYNSRDTKQNK